MTASRDEGARPPSAAEPTLADPDQQLTLDALGPRQRAVRVEHQRDLVAPPENKDREVAGAGGMRVGRYHLLEMVGAGGMGMVWGAWDPQLERRVALKLMQASGVESRERMLAEGQALAKLSHPNVVPIYDVGAVGDQVYLIMEWVRGATLRSFAKTAPALRALVEAYRQAGEGLAAAHRAGIIHRDFKPDNVIRGDDGRVRVLDFGLAQAEPEARPETAPGKTATAAPLDEPRADRPGSPSSAETARGERRAVMGTPRYMAPEQKRGDAATHATDQYAFCVSLAEAVTELCAARKEKAPGWISAITTRGLADSMDARYPSMQALLAALADDPKLRWRRRAAYGALALAASGAFIVGRTRAPEPAIEPCAGSGEELADVWGETQRRAVDERLRSLAVLSPAEVFATTLDLDRYREQWTTEHRRACLARERKELTPAIYERRLSCLARAKGSLAAVADLLATVSGDALGEAMLARRGLPVVAACSTADDSAVIPPAPTIAAQVAAVVPDVERARVLSLAQHPTALERASAAVTTAKATGYDPLIARALLVLGRTQISLFDRPAAIASLTEALRLALQSFDELVALEAYARLVWAGEPKDPPDNWMVMELLARRAGAPGRFGRALMHNNRGGRYFQAKQHDKAREQYLLALAESELGSRPTPTDANDEDIELLAIFQNLALIERNPHKREALALRTLDDHTRTLGKSHPRTTAVREQLAMTTPPLARARSLLEEACRDYQRWKMQRAFTICAYEAGWLADEQRDRPAALEWMRRASDYVSTTKGPREKGNIAKAYVAMYAPGSPPLTAAALSQIVQAAAARTGWMHRIDIADAQALIARWHADHGDAPAARAARAAAAAALAEISEPVYERRVARARTELALVTSDRTAARDLAQQALAWYRVAGGYAEEVARLEPLAK